METDMKKIKLDELYEKAKVIVLKDKNTSISYLQRTMGIGYNRAGNIMDQLEMMGIVTSADTKCRREIIS